MNRPAEKFETAREIFAPLRANAEFQQLRREIQAGATLISIAGLTSNSAKAFVLSALQAELKKTLVIIGEKNKDLENWECDLNFFQSEIQNPKSKIEVLPSFENDIYSGISPHAETLEKRALTLWNLVHEKADFVLTTARSLITRTINPAELKNLGALLRRDEDFAPEDLIEKLVGSGFVREEPVKSIGEFSLRGGVIDVWSPNNEFPVRIEFFGDTVDSIREFDAETQLSVQQIKEVALAPMREFTANSGDFNDWSFFAAERFAAERFARALKDRTQFAAEGEDFAGWENLFALVKPRKSSIFDYLPDCVFVVDEPAAIEQTLQTFYETLENRFRETDTADELGLAPQELFLTAENLRENLNTKQRLELRALGRTAAQTDEEFQISDERLVVNGELAETPRVFSHHSPLTTHHLFLFPTAERAREIEFSSRPTRKFHGRIADFIKDVQTRRQSDAAIFAQTLIVAETSGMAERLREIFREYEVNLPDENFLTGDLSGGFEMPDCGIIFQTENDIFGDDSQIQSLKSKAQSPKTKSNKLKTEAFISDFRDLKIGDFVVHIDHGIGKFAGLQTIESAGVEREFMLLLYADNAKLFVPVERMDLVSRYSSAESTTASVDKLGGIGWAKTKAKAKRAMRDMTDELLRLYAERKLVQGFSFSADSPWQEEFEDAFPYDLTADQATATDDTKQDMENPTPMDRLIVGDVGYGKTEVAMRAAFKAVMDSKQVAILTPTTVLAYQHFETFKKRFAAFPVKIDLLSRFRSPKQQKEVVKAAEEGTVDILIGTHRILSADVKLPKLGLVVVDEEQRFGVAHKEKLKQLKKKVDVLTLSATPIPRTLNMSLLGMRDMSVIETPPRDRLAINTQVVQFSDNVIKSAIELEMARGGQVFFIHNRVETIDSIAALVQKIVPNARIVIAHGQMNEQAMEKAMLDFIDFQYDVLVATTIIENGIDIPRANTIIINRADNYGLSQLYQLRGRVGRSSRRAYAYLLIPGEKQLTPIARRRLSAIREFSDLGAGFRIAALDLELRGAGNLLGGQQSGHLDALGFDLYVKMLERTIAEIRGEEIEDEISVSINLGIDVSIPNDFINDMSQRLRTYKRISAARNEETLRTLMAELADRYGKLPESVENLFNYSRLRRMAENMRVVSIDKTAGGFAVKLNEKAKVAPEKLMAFIQASEGASFTPSGALKVELPRKFDGNILEKVREALEEIRLAE